VLIGVLAVFPTYLLALKLFDRRVAVLSSLIMIVNPYFIAFNRMGYNNSQAILPVVLALYLLYIAVERSSLFYACLSGIASGAGFYAYSAGRLALVAGLMFIGYLLVARRASKAPVETPQPLLQRLRPVLLICAVFIGATALTIAPHFVYVNTHDPNALRLKTLESLFPSTGYGLSIFPEDALYRDYSPIQFDNYSFFFRPDLYGLLLIRGVVRSLLAFQMDKLVDTLYIAGPLAGPVAATFYVIGLIAAFKQARRQRYALLLLWFLGGVVFLSILNSFPPRHAHMVSIIPVMAILTALGVVACADFAGKYMLRWRFVAPLVTALIVGGIAGTGLRNYFVDVPAHYLPDAENIMDFHTLQSRDATQVIYINNDPNWEKFIPGLIATLPHTPTFRTMTLDRLAASGVLRPDTGCTFFFVERDKDAVVALLRQRLQVSSIEPFSYRDANGRVILMSWTFNPSSS